MNKIGTEEARKEYTFLKHYLNYVESQESPRCFHVWTAISCCAMLTARRVFLDRGHYTLYPNFYTVLVSSSALCRKSTAINIGVKCIEDIREQLREMALASGIPTIISGKVTSEALFRIISEEGIKTAQAGAGNMEDGHRSRPLTILSLELGVLISRMAQQSGLIDILTDIFECPKFRDYPTKTSGVDSVYRAYLNILGATTPDWMQRQMTSAIASEGFIGRCMLIYSNTPYKRIPNPIITPDQEESGKYVKEKMLKLALSTGPMYLTDIAQKEFDKWYYKRPENPTDDSLNTGFYGREHDHLLKLCMVLALMRESFEIELIDFEIALLLLEDMKRYKDSIFFGSVLAYELPQMKFVEKALREVPGTLTRTELTGKVYKKVTKEQLDQCLETLLESGNIEITRDRQGDKGKYTTYYRWLGHRS